MFQPGVAVVERDPAIESLIELYLGSRKAETAVLRRDLKAASVPLHDVVVADDAFMREAADALEIVGGGPPSFGGLARSAREAAVVVGEELAQDGVGGIADRRRRARRSSLRKAILQHAPETFDAAFGLGRLCGDEGDAELCQGAAELSGLALAGELFLDGPVVIVANEDAAAIAVEGEGDTVAAQAGSGAGGNSLRRFPRGRTERRGFCRRRRPACRER